MITHKEALANLTSATQIDLDMLYLYIKQQEEQSKELERQKHDIDVLVKDVLELSHKLARLEELLGLYQRYIDDNDIEYYREILKLEKELEELK